MDEHLKKLQEKIHKQSLDAGSIVNELKELNLRLDKLWLFVSDDKGYRAFHEIRRQIHSTLWLSHSLGEDLTKTIKTINDIR